MADCVLGPWTNIGCWTSVDSIKIFLNLLDLSDLLAHHKFSVFVVQDVIWIKPGLKKSNRYNLNKIYSNLLAHHKFSVFVVSRFYLG